MSMPGSSFDYRRLPKLTVSCPLCEGDNFERLAGTDRYRMGICTVACRKCGLVLTNPRPSSEALHEFYRLHYRPLYRKADRPSLDYIREYGLDKRAAYTSDFLEHAGTLFEGIQVLDVGCAEGSLLGEINQRFPTANLTGIEPNPEFAEFANKIVRCRIFSALDDLTRHRATKFDLIIVNHVLEHTDQPIHFLRELSQLLSAQGCVYVDVPNAEVYSSLNDLHIAHLYHFSSRTLAAIAGKSGLCVSRSESHSPPMHPPSLRVLLRIGDTPGSVQLNGRAATDQAIHERIRAINQGAWIDHLRQSFLFRLVHTHLQGVRARLSPKGKNAGL